MKVSEMFRNIGKSALKHTQNASKLVALKYEIHGLKELIKEKKIRIADIVIEEKLISNTEIKEIVKEIDSLNDEISEKDKDIKSI